MPSDKSVIVITGANRGLGLELASQVLAGSHPASTEVFPKDCLVVATARDPSSAKELAELGVKYGARLDIQKLDVSDEKANDAFADYVAQKYGRTDVLILNAGVGSSDRPSTFKRQLAIDMFIVNTFAPAEQTRAFLPVLKATAALKTAGGKVDRANPPVRVTYISSSMGSIGETSSAPAPSYRASKAALNMYARTFAIENPDVAFLILHPGWVATDMGSSFGSPPLDAKTSVAHQLQRIAEVSLDSSGKGLITWDGKTLRW